MTVSNDDQTWHAPGFSKLEDTAIDDMECIFQALGSAIRMKILASLSHGSRAAGEIAAQFDISKPAISKHLSVLEQAGLVVSRKKGSFVYYSLMSGEIVKTFKRYLEILERALPVNDSGARESSIRKVAPAARRDVTRDDLPPVVTWLQNPK